MHTLSFKIERDLILVNILSALLITVIAFFPDSPARIILGLPFILFFLGYVLICALFPEKKYMDIVERLALGMGLSIAVTSLIGLALNYIPFEIRLYPVTFSLFLFIVLMSIVAMYRRECISQEDAFAPLLQMSVSGSFERIKNEFTEFGKGNRIIKIVAITAFVFIILVLIIIARTPPASGYEISIYEAYPWYFWIFIIVGIACGLSILVFSAFYHEGDSSGLWALGLFAIILSNVIILMLPIIFRGYTFYGRGDPLIHIGEIKDILSYGHIGEWNFYPVTHILATTLVYITGLNLRWIFGIGPSFFYVVYILSIYLLSRVISEDRGQSLLITAFGTLMVYGLSHSRLTPGTLAFFLLPLILFLFYWSRTPPLRPAKMVLFILFLLMLPFLHPIGSMFLILIFLCLNASELIYKTIKRYQAPSFAIRITNPSLIVFVTFLIWFSSFSAFGANVRYLTNWLYYQIGQPALARYTESLERADLSVFQFTELLLKMYGQYLLYIAVAVILCIVILWRIRTLWSGIELNQVTFAMIFAVFGTVALVFIFGDYPGGWTRPFSYSIFAATVLNGLGVHRLARRGVLRDKKSLMARMLPFMVIVILVAASIFSLFNVSFSPITISANHHVTQMELDGMGWLLNYSNEQILIDDLSFEQYRFTYALIGYDAAKGVKNIRSWGVAHHPPRHFNYTQNRMLGQSYQEDRYLVTTKLSRESSHKIYPKYSDLWSFNPNDFNNLDEHDPSVSRVYANNEVDVFYVRSQPL